MQNEETNDLVFQDATFAVTRGASNEQGEYIVKLKSEADLAKRRHDIVGAARTLQLAIGNIKEGYRFDDALAEKKISAIESAAKVLLTESELIKAILSDLHQTKA